MTDIWQKMKDDKRPLTKRTWAGIGLIAFGIFVTMIFVCFYSSTPTIGPVFIILGMGVYFLGITITVNGLIAQDENEMLLKNVMLSKKIDELSDKIEKLQNK